MKRTLEDLHRAKAARRKALAAMPYEEKVRIMEELQQMGRAMIAARPRLPRAKSRR